MGQNLVLLLIVNFPVYIFFGKVLFDSKDKAADTFYETTVMVLKAIFIPRFIRIFMDDDDTDGAIGLFQIFSFFVTCGLIVFIEFWLIFTIIDYFRDAGPQPY